VALAAPASGAVSKPQAPPQTAAGTKAAGTRAWFATLHCDAFRGSHEFFNEVPVQFEDGTFILQRRPGGMGGHFRLQGKPASDGTLLLTGSVVAPRGRMRGEDLPVRLEGALDAGRYVTRGYLGSRPCEVDIARR